MSKIYIIATILLTSVSTAHASSGFTWLGGLSHQLGLAEHTLTLAVVCLLVALVGVVYSASLKKVPNVQIPDKGLTLRNFVEGLGNWLYDTLKENLGEKRASQYYSLIASIFIFVLSGNLIGMIPGFSTPMANLNTTLALGLFVFVYYNYVGIKTQGFVNHVKHLMGPIWWMAFLIFPLEVISHSVRPISLGLRLRGNMNGDHMVLSMFQEMTPYFVPVIFLFLGLLVCFVQALVFTLLTVVYIGLATEEHHDEHHEGAH